MRVAITGTGALSGYGVGLAALLDGVASRRSAIGPSPLLESHRFDQAATISADFDPKDHLQPKLVRKMERSQHFATIVIGEAIRNAFGDDDVDSRCGLLMGSACGPLEAAEANYSVLRTERRSRLSPFGFLRFQFSGLTAWPTIAHNLQGPGAAVAAFVATGLVNVGLAARWITTGRTHQMVAGAADACREEFHVGLTAMGFISGEPAGPQPLRAFDASATGTVLGDGAAAFVLESEDRAAKRGATTVATVLGMGHTHTGEPPDRPVESPEALTSAMESCLAEAALSAADIDLVIATGSGVPAEDRCEAGAIARVFAEHGSIPPILALKGYLGHTMGASGLLEAIVALQSAEAGGLPPTLGLREPVSTLPHVVDEAQIRGARNLLVLAHGIGGHCAALALARP